MTKPPKRPVFLAKPERQLGRIVRLDRWMMGRIHNMVVITPDHSNVHCAIDADRQPVALNEAQQAVLINKAHPQPNPFAAADLTRVFVLLQQQRTPVVFAFRLPPGNQPAKNWIAPVVPLRPAPKPVSARTVNHWPASPPRHS